MAITPHGLGVHKVLKYIPLNKIFDYPSKRRLAKAVNIADLRLCAKARAHKVGQGSFVAWENKYTELIECELGTFSSYLTLHSFAIHCHSSITF